LHLVPNPVLVVDGHGRLHFANRAGETLLARQDGLRLQNGTVTAVHRPQVKLLAEAFAKAARGKPGDALPRRDLALARRDAPHPLLLRLTPLPRSRGKYGDGEDGPRIALFVEPGPAAPTRLQALKAALKLTRAEGRLLDGLVAGQSLGALAEEHGVSVNTLRVQLHRLFEKTGTHRQAELVRFALTAAGPPPEL
jgi:DNA-binding CsgD family transcriptional regulator